MAIRLEEKKLKGSLLDREKIILEISKGKKVLHLGCTDHPFTMERFMDGTLLHDKIQKIAKKLVGIDISKEGIEAMKYLGFVNLMLANVEEVMRIEPDEDFDVIVAGELLEHISNVGRFFENVSHIMNENTLLVITVPNAHSIKGFLRVLFGNELIHPDHVYYFSPATIDHISKRYMFKVQGYHYYLGEPSPFIKKLLFMPLKYFIKFFSPFVADGMVFVLEKTNNTHD